MACLLLVGVLPGCSDGVTQISVNVEVVGYRIPIDAATLRLETRETDGRTHEFETVTLEPGRNYSFGVVPRGESLEPARIAVLLLDTRERMVDSWTDTVAFEAGETVEVRVVLSRDGTDAGVPDAGCTFPEVECGGSCVNTDTDLFNCGMCDVVCGMTETCVMGSCVDTGCSSGQQSCGGSCVDTSSDESHCGECDNACTPPATCETGLCAECFDPEDCPTGEDCVMGECVPGTTCPDGRIPCGKVCVDPSIDSRNCGGCGIVCAEGCTMGECDTEICGNLMDDDMDMFVDEGCP